MRLEKETAIYQLGAIAADIDGATTLAKGKNKIFYQDTAPASGMNAGDLWFKVDSSGGSSLYEYEKTGSNPDTYAWTLRQLGQGSLLANSVTANEINVNNLSAISGILGSVTVGGANNEDGVITMKNASDDTMGWWDNTGLHANAGAIGPWTIGSSGIYNGKPTLDSTANGAYVGIDGIKLEDADSSKEIATSGGIYLKEKTNGGLSTFLNMESYDGFDGTFTPSFVDVRNTTTNDYVSISCGTNWAFGVNISLRDTNYNWGIGIGDINGCIAFNHPADAPLITNYYNSTVYNILRNHNNGNISVSASSGTLYLGYENTVEIDLLNGKATLSSSGALQTGGTISVRNAAEGRIVATNDGVNRIYLYANSSGTVGIYSYSADGTGRHILARANNSDAIYAYGDWTFNTGIKGNNNFVGAPVLTENAGASRISYMASASGYVLRVNALWGGSSYATATATFTSSDIRLKDNIIDCTVTALPIVNAIRMREFDWKDGRHQTIGFVADELEELDSRLSIGGGYTETGDMNVKSVDTFYLLGYAIKAIQELSAEVNRLKGAA